MVLVWTGSALADTAPVTIETPAPALETADGGGYTTTVALTNQTDDPNVRVKATPIAAEQGCQVTPKSVVLPPAQQTTVTYSLGAGCEVKTNAISFTLTGPDATHPFTVVAAPKPAGKPEWGALKAFFVMLLAAAVLAIASLKRAGQGLSTELQYLDSAWSFNDSWVSNVTVIGGLLAGIFGSSDVVTALLGSDAKSSVALATVGVAVAAALVAAAPIILVITKGPNGFYTVYGLALAAVLTVSAAGGEVWVVYRSGAKLDLGGWQDYIVYFAIAALVLLGLYGFISLVSTVKDGTTQPPATVSDTLTGAAWIVGALTALHPEGRVPDLEYLVPKGGPPIPSVMAAAPTKPKRSALL